MITFVNLLLLCLYQLQVCIDDPSGTSGSLDLTLAHTIDPEQASTKIYSTKVSF